MSIRSGKATQSPSNATRRLISMVSGDAGDLCPCNGLHCQAIQVNRHAVDKPVPKENHVASRIFVQPYAKLVYQDQVSRSRAVRVKCGLHGPSMHGSWATDQITHSYSHRRQPAGFHKNTLQELSLVAHHTLPTLLSHRAQHHERIDGVTQPSYREADRNAFSVNARVGKETPTSGSSSNSPATYSVTLVVKLQQHSSNLRCGCVLSLPPTSRWQLHARSCTL